MRNLLDSRSIFSSVGLFMQQSLAEVGITAKIKKVTYDDIVTFQLGGGIKDGKRPYDMALCEWFSDFPDPSGDLTPLLMSNGGGEGGSNTSVYTNKKVDELLLKQAASSDDAERTKLMLETFDIVNDELPYFVWGHQNYLVTTNKEIADSLQIDAFMIWNFYVQDIKTAE